MSNPGARSAKGRPRASSFLTLNMAQAASLRREILPSRVSIRAAVDRKATFSRASRAARAPLRLEA
ncbi:hypothetical protein D3C73_1573790 [compost metagenome]